MPWFNRMGEGVVQAGKEFNLNASQVGPSSTDAPQQVKIIEDLIARKVDAITIVPNDANVLEPVFKKATSQLALGCPGDSLVSTTMPASRAFLNTGSSTLASLGTIVMASTLRAIRGPSSTDAPQQVKIIEDLIARKVDAITIVPNDANVLEPVFKKARDAGIVVLTNESPGQPSAPYAPRIQQRTSRYR